MILRSLSEVPGATYTDLRESLAWWSGAKLFIGQASQTGPKHQLAMLAAIRVELKRRGIEPEDTTE